MKQLLIVAAMTAAAMLAFVLAAPARGVEPDPLPVLRDPLPVADRNIFAAKSIKAALESAADDGEWRIVQICNNGNCTQEYRWFPRAATAVERIRENVNDALAQLNAQRAERGLRPYIEDPALTQAAQACAEIRASRLIFGHVDDFNHIPAGAQARASGCAAWPVELGFGACDTYANWTYAGAAWVMGRDGKRYCHAFYR